MDILELTDIVALTCVVTVRGSRGNGDSHCEDNKNTVDEINGSDVNYSKFYTNFLYYNKPCLIKSITSDWNSQINWVSDNKPNFIYLKRKYGHCDVPVANCNEQYFNAQSKSNMKLNEYLEYWEKYGNNNYPQEMPCLYLKDWHFMNEFPEESIYRVPSIFASDWMNEYLINNSDIGDDYRFVYMGPKGSWTPLHEDVFSSFSWSVNICGRKKWILFPPGTENVLKDKFGKLVYDVNSKDLENASKYPNYREVKNKITLIQEVGDAVFVPTGWHHQVWNLEDTISINHNWINACNVAYMWRMLQKGLFAVKKELNDCKDMENWEDQCQTVLKCTFGMNYIDFMKFLIFIAERRLESLKSGSFVSVSGNWSMGRNHMLFDLININPILYSLRSLNLPYLNNFADSLTEFVNKIDHFLFTCS